MWLTSVSWREGTLPDDDDADDDDDHKCSLSLHCDKHQVCCSGRGVGGRCHVNPPFVDSLVTRPSNPKSLPVCWCSDRLLGHELRNNGNVKLHLVGERTTTQQTGLVRFHCWVGGWIRISIKLRIFACVGHLSGEMVFGPCRVHVDRIAGRDGLVVCSAHG